LNLVLDELITNIVLYGAGSGQQHVPAAVVQLEVGATPRGVEVCLRDSGVVFNPLERPPADTAASLEDREVGGLGIHFLREMAQDLHWQRAGGMNELRFVMPTQPSP
jgi:serine/threonine-protein kinase RsbW